MSYDHCFTLDFLCFWISLKVYSYAYVKKLKQISTSTNPSTTSKKSEMNQLKTMMQSISDPQLIRVFLEFVHIQNLPYQKTSQEISYKCYQASWIIPSGKAMGYGRTENQAYSQALRNLLDFLLEDECTYRQGLMRILNGKEKGQKQGQNIFSTKARDLLLNNGRKERKYIFKTEYSQSGENDIISDEKNHLCSRQKERESSYKKLSRSKSKKSSIGFQSSKKLNLQGATPLKNSANFSNLCINKEKQRKSSSNHQTNSGNSCVYYSKIILNKNTHSNQNQSMANQQVKSYAGNELKIARERLKNMEKQLNQINRENEELKDNISDAENQRKKENEQILKEKNTKIKLEDDFHNESIEISTGTASGTGLSKQIGSIGISNGTAHFNASENSPLGKGNKLKIPKLKLEVLPNYHKKSQKSMNDSLLAIYNEKHSVLGMKKVS